jgi:hypothetical protein
MLVSNSEQKKRRGKKKKWPDKFKPRMEEKNSNFDKCQNFIHYLQIYRMTIDQFRKGRRRERGRREKNRNEMNE